MTDTTAAATAAAGPAVAAPGSTPRRFHWTPGLVTGLVLLGAVVLVGIVAPLLLQEQADTMAERAASPSAAHPLGTDQAGHDMLARSLVATRLTLVMTLGATAIAVLVGIVAGTAVWLLPRRAREVCLRVIDAMVAFPGLLLALVVAAILGAGAVPAVIAIGVAGIPTFARLTANLAAKVSQRDYVSTARLLGVGNRRIVTDHMLPNMAEPLLVLAASTFAQSLTAISALSFVGLGVQSPQYDFGKLLNEALPSLLAGRPEQTVGPAVLIVVTGLAAMLVGDGLAAAADPRAGRRASAASVRGAGTTLVPGLDAMVRVEDLWVRTASGAPLVKGISFTVARGEIVGIVGESGSGKSLTAMSVARLLADGLEAEAATMRLDDVDLLGRVDPRVMAQTVSLVYQDPGSTFNPALRLGTQLTEVLRTHRGQSRSSARATVLDALRRVHLTLPEKRLRQHPHELSGGMRQRAMIAAALSVDPKLIIADEPTTALDVTVQAEILRELKRLNRETGTAVMFISHDIGVVRALCDRVLVMNGGEIVEEIDADRLDAATAVHPYTRALLAATPSLTERVGELPVVDWRGEQAAAAATGPTTTDTEEVAR
ncbi:ABC-type dipeptide/oligopeptide/nickel transport system ATPase component/ABC-type dipeptide/oligopeptide/nickel transport system permease subunit [Clavibacter michiganensis]|uniref:dipeptide/oligopeptide/nickel ABC transporter permease/ATP-binding protein n=1 Tax=Clavibacter michiganensis TaxID=28447 RepID=UPI001AE9A3D3|nr:dipeptide/oligopeptide/nickel ABC transporter permease/ATP-binding protein [Clavibacter michiganensis]MBP2457915.1 ABC-type dipeptide/oligopeptide/nickel transport system ATPase component/ABC-type dipeptide/oligopeptide/nickel transport system permease subunit [Clavibacter michiganensis]MDQ0410485.1 ABC-type dipeptide/oligopeptide/nickel transport system ATPase component/ABC-type dipeptide/oligopeptide/nickel transport system permease subunit [Clavibacter michiganensis]